MMVCFIIHHHSIINMPLLKNRLLPYLRLMRLHKPIGIFLLLWPTLWALWIAAKGIPDLTVLVIFLLGTILMRSAGCVINDIADRNFDGYVKRTCQRPLITGEVSLKEALILFGVLCGMAFILILFLNRFTQLLAVIGLLLAIIYPFTKRFTYWPQLVLGATFGWAVPMAFAAQSNTLPATAWILYAAAILWPLAYDTMYGMADREDDRKIGIKSTALLFAQYDRLFIGIIQILVFLLMLIVGCLEQLNPPYYLGLLGAALFAIYQQHLIKQQLPENCFKAFLNNNWLGFIIFLGLFIANLC